MADIFDQIATQPAPTPGQPTGHVFDHIAPSTNNNDAAQRLALARPDLAAPPAAAGNSMPMQQVDASWNPITPTDYSAKPQTGGAVINALGDAAIGFVKNAGQTIAPGQHTAAAINSTLGTAT